MVPGTKVIKFFDEKKSDSHVAVINKIIPFSNVDGPGNRLVIFFQGCNLHCVYCHNSETINICNSCGECVDGCPTGSLVNVIHGDVVHGDRYLESFGSGGQVPCTKVEFNSSECIECDQCIRTCRYNSSPRTRIYTPTEIMKEIEGYKLFIRGITVSGGEPTLQAPFITELFKLLKPLGLSCFVDTNGVFDIENKEMKELIEVTDKYMIDIKTVGETEVLCGVKFDNHLKNLRKLLKIDKVYEVRTVLIKSFMDMEKTVAIVSDILKDYPKVKYKLIKVHPAGLHENQRKPIVDNVPSDQEVLKLAELAKKTGVKIVKAVL